MLKKAGAAAGLAVLLAAGVIAYVWFSGGSGEPSTPVTAPPVAAPSSVAAAPPETAAAAVADAADGGPEAANGGAGAAVFRIDGERSSVRFEIDELLNGDPKRVVGVTSEAAGEVLVDFDDPPASRIGEIVVNVRTLETDSGFRDRAMRGPILGSARDENEFAVFEPSSIEGLPARAEVGARLPLTVAGGLTLSGATRPVVFEIEVELVSFDLIRVTGSALVLRSDFGLTIPAVPGVSNVSDEILLALDLVAAAVRS